MDVWSNTKGQKVQCGSFYSILPVQSVADVVRHGRLRWFGNLERSER